MSFFCESPKICIGDEIVKIKNVTLIGGGVLGSQIAYQSAYKGFNVTTYVRSEASIGRAKPKLDRLHAIYISELNAAKSSGGPVSRGLLPSAQDLSAVDFDALIENAETAYKNFKYTTDLKEAVSDSDLIIEALSEKASEKTDFYKSLQAYLPEKTILVTNSSTLLPSMLADSTGRPDRFLALHFANNIWKQNTAEIMGHDRTDPAVYEEVAEFAAGIGMVPLRMKKEKAGYILNSMLVPFLSAAEGLLADDISDAETIDKTWMLATGAPMGPFRILDIVGIDTAYNISSSNPLSSDPTTVQYRIAQMLKQYVDSGKTGVNAGEGFYKYR